MPLECIVSKYVYNVMYVCVCVVYSRSEYVCGDMWRVYAGQLSDVCT